MTEDYNETIRTAIAGIDKYSDALKELRKIEHEELIEELQAKKKENFQLVAKACKHPPTSMYLALQKSIVQCVSFINNLVHGCCTD